MNHVTTLAVTILTLVRLLLFPFFLSIFIFFIRSIENTERDPIKAKDYFVKACASNHAPSCYNLAVMYRLGDTGIEKNEQEFEKYKNRTNELVKVFGGVGGGARTG